MEKIRLINTKQEFNNAIDDMCENKDGFKYYLKAAKKVMDKYDLHFGIAWNWNDYSEEIYITGLEIYENSTYTDEILETLLRALRLIGNKEKLACMMKVSPGCINKWKQEITIMTADKYLRLKQIIKEEKEK
jgi:hypothetical protein